MELNLPSPPLQKDNDSSAKAAHVQIDLVNTILLGSQEFQKTAKEA